MITTTDSKVLQLVNALIQRTNSDILKWDKDLYHGYTTTFEDFFISIKYITTSSCIAVEIRHGGEFQNIYIGEDDVNVLIINDLMRKVELSWITKDLLERLQSDELSPPISKSIPKKHFWFW